MKKTLLIIFFTVLTINLIILGYWFIQKKYPSLVGPLFKPEVQSLKYPGEGEVAFYAQETYFAMPKGSTGRPQWISKSEIGNFSTDLYTVYTIPAQIELRYAVGSFQGWEDISGSLDKYILVKYPGGNLVHKWRVCFENSDLFKDQATYLLVENTSTTLDPSKKIEHLDNPFLSVMGFKTAEKLFKKGDTVTFVPVFDPPELSKKDSNGAYLAYQIIVRRAGGAADINKLIGAN